MVRVLSVHPRWKSYQVFNTWGETYPRVKPRDGLGRVWQGGLEIAGHLRPTEEKDSFEGCRHHEITW